MKALGLTLFGFCLAVSICGCAEEPQEHVHQTFPGHRPANFRNAVAAIAQRSEELATGGRKGSIEHQHLVDIIEWVPELAADSDLKIDDWNQAKAASERLRHQVMLKSLDMKKLEQVVSDDLEILRGLIKNAGVPEPDLYHHHQHHGHDHGEHGHAH